MRDRDPHQLAVQARVMTKRFDRNVDKPQKQRHNTGDNCHYSVSLNGAIASTGHVWSLSSPLILVGGNSTLIDGQVQHDPSHKPPYDNV